MSNNNVTIRKTTYTSDKVIIIVAILGLIFIIIYIYNNYKSLAIKPTGASLTLIIRVEIAEYTSSIAPFPSV